MSFESLGLRAELLRALTAQGYTNPTPVQAQAIPGVLEGRDLLAGAQTGTGKTAAFVLPILHNLAKAGPTRDARGPRVLILTPTRELAAQVGESVDTYGAFLKPRSAVIFGGVGFNPQADCLRRGVDILVATPGRLLDHAAQRTVDLSSVEVLVLDEADRMLDMGFIRDLRRIVALLPARRQNLMFSATYSDEIRQLANQWLQDPAVVEVARRNTAAETVDQRVHPVDKTRKRELLAHLIHNDQWDRVLVFTRTKHGANRLTAQLEKDGIAAAAIHGNKSQNARTSALKAFKEGRVRALVATDVAARGLDIDQLPRVVNFELPNVPEDYVHRIGRTGRAGANGHALSLVSEDEVELLVGIQKLLKREIPSHAVSGFEPERPLQLVKPVSAPKPKQQGRPQSQGRVPPQGQGRPQSADNGGRSRRRRRSRSRGAQGAAA